MRTKLLKKCFAAIGLLATLSMTAAQVPVQAAVASETKINIAITSADIKSGGEAELQAKVELGSGVMSLQGVYAYITLNRELTDGESMDVKQPSGDMAFTYGFKDNNKKQFEVMGLEQYGTNIADGTKKDVLFNIKLSGLKSPVSMYFDFIGEHSYLKTGAKTITETMIVKQGDLTSSTGFISVDGKKAEDTNPDSTGSGETYGKEDAGQLGAVTEDTTKKDTTDTTNKDTTNKDTTASTDTTNKDTTTSTDSTKTDINISTDTTKEDAASSTDSKTDSATTPTTGKDTTGSADSGKDGASGTSTDGTSMSANTVASSADSAVKGNSATTGKGDSTPKTRDTSNMIFGLVGLAAVVALIIIIVAAKAKTRGRNNR